MLQGIIDKRIEFGRECGMEVSVQETKLKRNGRETCVVKITRNQNRRQNVIYLNCLDSMITNNAIFIRVVPR